MVSLFEEGRFAASTGLGFSALIVLRGPFFFFEILKKARIFVFVFYLFVIFFSCLQSRVVAQLHIRV
jgi:hypothetical protein